MNTTAKEAKLHMHQKLTAKVKKFMHHRIKGQHIRAYFWLAQYRYLRKRYTGLMRKHEEQKDYMTKEQLIALSNGAEK